MDNKMISSFLWKFLERASTQVINLIIQVILARMISPENFGALAILVVFVNVSNIFVQKGFSSSLIRKKDVTEKDCNTVFTSSTAISIVLYIALFALSPWIAEIYELPVLVSALRVISLQLLFSSIYCVQNAILVREMQFKAIFIRGFVATTAAGIVGIAMATRGMGLWALVVQSLLNQLLLCTTAWFAVWWRPKLAFSMNSFREVFAFGSRILASELLSYSVESIRTLFIGGKYSGEMLSYYDRGQMYPSTLMRGIYDTVSGVMLPHFSREQDHADALKRDLIRSISMTLFLIMPVFVGMAAVGPILIEVLLTSKWIEAVPYFVLFCIYQIPYPIQGICRQVIYARGESGYVLKTEILKSILALVSLLVALSHGVMAIAVSALLTTYATTLISIRFTQKVIPIRIRDIGNALWKTSVACIVMYVAVAAECSLNIHHVFLLVIQFLTGMVVYMALSCLLKNEDLVRMMMLICNKIK